MSSGRLWWGRLGSLATLVVSSIVALLLCEVALRFVLRGDNVHATATLGTFVPDPELVWVNRPNVREVMEWGSRSVVLRTDARGHRVPDSLTSVNADAERDSVVVFAGDSYVFGNEVNAEETFVHLVGQSLASTAVVNLGVGGYSLDQSCLALRRYMTSHANIAQAYLAIYVGNDIDTAPGSTRTYRVDRYGYIRGDSTGRMWMVEARSFAVRHSRLAFHLGAAWRSIHASTGSASPGAASAAPDRWIYDEQAFVPERLDAHRRVLEALRDDARTRNVPITVVIIPDEGQVYGTRNDLPNRMLSRMLDELGMSFIDLLPEMKAVAGSRPRLWNQVFEGHLSPEGHEVVAGILTDHVLTAGSQ